MKLLLTGPPKIGKSTIFSNVLQLVDHKQGFITQEIREDAQRVGFKLLSPTGYESILAHINLNTNHKVSRYFVDAVNLDLFIKPLFDFNDNQLLYIDEIGEMELFSTKFKDLVESYLYAKNHFIGTITSVYSDEFIQKIKLLDLAIIVELTLENREKVQEVLKIIISALDNLTKLSLQQQQAVQRLSGEYFSKDQYIQLKKLFINALLYVIEKRVIKINPNTYIVKGNTRDHQVTKNIDNWVCDCDLYTGKGSFTNLQGECSHIQSTKLFLI